MAHHAAGRTRNKDFCSEFLQYRAQHGPDLWSEENLRNVIDLWQLTPEVAQQLLDLKERVADVDHWKNDPHILMRFLRGPWGYKEAENMFRRMIAWRKQNGVDTILDDYVPPQLLLDCVPTAILKDWDREGDPVYIERGGAFPLELLKRYSREEMIRHCIWTRERNTNGRWMNEYERQTGKHIKAITVIYDCKGLSARHLQGIDYLKEISKITQEYFPNPIKRMIIIRAPKVFTVLWGLIRHFFPATARAKMIFLGNTGYLEVLDKYVDIRKLPRSIYEGGTGDTAVGMMQCFDGVESVQAYLDANYPSKDSTAETDSESLASEPGLPQQNDHQIIRITGKVILQGSYRWTDDRDS